MDLINFGSTKADNYGSLETWTFISKKKGYLKNPAAIDDRHD
ncbi:hypothetical protein [Chryseobacterium aureum]|nr:hypothetical protein [Chryseobacterium aureum]